MNENEMRTVYVVDEAGGTFAFLNRTDAEMWHEHEAEGGAVGLVIFETLAPADLVGDALADWCVRSTGITSASVTTTQHQWRGDGRSAGS